MNLFLRTSVISALLFFSQSSTQGPLHFSSPPYLFTAGGMFKPEMFYGKNISLLNNTNTSDRIWFARHTLDLFVDVSRLNVCNEVDVEFFVTVRNKAIWGNAASIAATTDATIKDIDAVLGTHRHSLPRHIFWIREGWLTCDVGSLFHLWLPGRHLFTLGAFPFQLGRGIALGDAFAVGPELLGFYTDTVVDQYAFGARLTGDIVEKKLGYDLYTAILNNKSSGLSDTAERIRGQEFGRRFDPIRGFGIINYVVAGRLRWTPIEDVERLGNLYVEPYWLFNSDPEQKVVFLGDATSKLGTLGLAAEYLHHRFEIGFDCAFNVGYQHVKALDRNQVIKKNRDARPAFLNSHVFNDANNQEIPFVSSGAPAQRAIYDSFDNEFSETKNGQVITTIPTDIGFMPGPVTMRNAPNRFRNPYSNKYQGWMAVVDGSWWLCPGELVWNVGAGVASGDDNPNEETIDGKYSGFIGLQELYSGKRVRSAFVLGGAGKIKRPLSPPDEEQAPSEFAQVVSGFTNLVFCGSGFVWRPQGHAKGLTINPNLLAYWQQHPMDKFDALLKQRIKEKARTYLGTEINLFADYRVFDTMKIYFVGSVFIPGGHYSDIRGLPLTPDQQAALDRLDTTGFTDERIPNIGRDTAYTFNIGVEFRF